MAGVDNMRCLLIAVVLLLLVVGGFLGRRLVVRLLGRRRFVARLRLVNWLGRGICRLWWCVRWFVHRWRVIGRFCWLVGGLRRLIGRLSWLVSGFGWWWWLVSWLGGLIGWLCWLISRFSWFWRVVRRFVGWTRRRCRWGFVHRLSRCLLSIDWSGLVDSDGRRRRWGRHIDS